MSNLLNQVKDKIEATLNKGDNPKSDNHGPHSSNVGNKVDPYVDSDRDGRSDPTSRVGGYGNTQTHAHHATTVGSGGVGSSGTYGSSTNDPAYDNPQSANAGPHSSNILNKVDPRVDSDRDNRNDPTSRVGGYGNTQHHGDNYGQTGGVGGLGTTDTGYGGSTGGYDTSTGYAGQTGHTTHSSHTGHTGHTGGLAAATGSTAGSGYTGTSDTYDNPRSTNAGPHGSNLLNKADPRHDSDRDHRNDPTSRVGGYGTQQDEYGRSAGVQGGYGSGTTGTTGGYGSENTGSYGTGASGYGDSYNTPGSGNARNTAGPHNSDILNKVDPRVDSDLDGSKTYGGNATHR